MASAHDKCQFVADTCDTVIYNNKRIFGLCSGSWHRAPRNPLQFQVLRRGVSFIMLMRGQSWRRWGRVLGASEANPVITVLELSVPLLGGGDSEKDRGAVIEFSHQWPMT